MQSYTNPQLEGRCDECGAPFTRPAKALHKRFCSKKCSETYWRKARNVGDAALTAAKEIGPAA